MRKLFITLAAVFIASLSLLVSAETKAQCYKRCQSDYTECTYYATDMDACAVSYEGCKMGCDNLNY